MTQDEIIEMADKCGLLVTQQLEAFAKLLRNDYSNKHAQLWLKRIDEAVKAEREACAQVCENRYSDHPDLSIASGEAGMCAYHIRARGEA